MHLFKRINTLIQSLENGNRASLCRKIGVNPSTFIGYLNEKGQQKIKFSTLIRIFEEYPEISRDWLFFGDGEMLAADEESRKRKLNASSAPERTKAHELTDPIAQRIVATKDSMIEAGADNQTIQAAIQAIIKNQGIYSASGGYLKDSSYRTVAESHAEYGRKGK